MAAAKEWKGVIIEESLEDKKLLKDVYIVKAKTVFNIFASWHQPKIWHMHEVAVEGNKVNAFCQKAKRAIKARYWYIDLSYESKAIIVFKGKVFKMMKAAKESIRKAKEYGKLIGVPERQLDFDRHWQRGK